MCKLYNYTEVLNPKISIRVGEWKNILTPKRVGVLQTSVVFATDLLQLPLGSILDKQEQHN